MGENTRVHVQTYSHHATAHPITSRMCACVLSMSSVHVFTMRTSLWLLDMLPAAGRSCKEAVHSAQPPDVTWNLPSNQPNSLMNSGQGDAPTNAIVHGMLNVVKQSIPSGLDINNPRRPGASITNAKQTNEASLSIEMHSTIPQQAQCSNSCNSQFTSSMSGNPQGRVKLPKPKFARMHPKHARPSPHVHIEALCFDQAADLRAPYAARLRCITRL